MIHIVKKVKCQRCKQQFERLEGNYVKISAGYVHKKCEDEHQTHMQERKELIEYLCETYSFTYPDESWLKEIKRYHDERNYRYKAMQLTLQYAFEVRNMIPNVKYRLGIIPNMYEEARRYYQAQQDVGIIEELKSYICEKYDIEFLNPMIENQIQKYITKYKYSYDGILAALKYGFDYKDRKAELEYGISFVPYLYNAAQADYQRKQQMRETDVLIEERVVTVNKKKYKPRIQQIDMSQFDEED